MRTIEEPIINPCAWDNSSASAIRCQCGKKYASAFCPVEAVMVRERSTPTSTIPPAISATRMKRRNSAKIPPLRLGFLLRLQPTELVYGMAAFIWHLNSLKPFMGISPSQRMKHSNIFISLTWTMKHLGGTSFQFFLKVEVRGRSPFSPGPLMCILRTRRAETGASGCGQLKPIKFLSPSRKEMGL